MNASVLPTWNPFAPGYMDDPFPQFQQLRRANPVHRAINGRWLVFKYQDAKTVLRNPAFHTVKFSQALAAKEKFAGARGGFGKLSEISAKWLLFSDPPEHTGMRSMLARIWNTIDVADAVEAVTQESLDRLARRPDAEIINDFATFVPSNIVCHILGLPQADAGRFRGWSYALNSMFEPFATLHDFVRFNRTIEEFSHYIDGIVALKKDRPDDRFISRLIEENARLPEPLDASGINSVIAFMFFASIETSINVFGQSVLSLVQNPGQLRLLAEDGCAVPTAVEELLRFISPNQYTTRIAAEDTELGGERIKRGEFVMISTASANRDEEVFEDGEQLDLCRNPNPHLSFGFGLHYCVGARLARLELQTSIPALLKRFPDIALPPGVGYEWDSIILNRGLRALPVRLT